MCLPFLSNSRIAGLPSREVKVLAEVYCVSLSNDDTGHLRKHLEDAMPDMSDGSIHIIARAWAVRGAIQA